MARRLQSSLGRLMLSNIRTPYFLIEEDKLLKNLKLLKEVKEKAGCKILLAQKAFSSYAFYPLIAEYLDGVTASGLYEAKLGFEEMKKENHVFSPAYQDEDFDEIVDICDHIIFNSFSQLEKFQDKVILKGKSFGLRINPEHSTQGGGMYDPCAIGSRFGVKISDMRDDLMSHVDGLHFHTLCEQGSEPFVETLDVFEKVFKDYIPQLKWVNFGGGHHITRDDYNVELLITSIQAFKARHPHLTIYLEPGEAVVLNAGVLVSKVIDLVNNGIDIAILDTSATCHMPDVLEVPYTPRITSSLKDAHYKYRLGGPSCLAGDVIGDYSFDHKLEIGEELVFEDMALYTIVKTNTFNGIPLPSIALKNLKGEIKCLKEFSYSDFKSRL